MAYLYANSDIFDRNPFLGRTNQTFYLFKKKVKNKSKQTGLRYKFDFLTSVWNCITSSTKVRPKLCFFAKRDFKKRLQNKLSIFNELIFANRTKRFLIECSSRAIFIFVSINSMLGDYQVSFIFLLLYHMHYTQYNTYNHFSMKTYCFCL